MREIKFRSWDKDEKKMYYLDKSLDSNILQAMYASEVIQGRGNIELMQYTGLKDKNGKEIYEGDIIKSEAEPNRYEQVTQKVYWDESEAGFRIDAFRFGNEVYLSRTEVIGNIYENTELLK